MALPQIAVIVGSNRRESINRKLAQALIKLGAGKFDAKIVRIDDLPAIRKKGFDGTELVKALLFATFEGGLRHGLFHGDLQKADRPRRGKRCRLSAIWHGCRLRAPSADS